MMKKMKRILALSLASLMLLTALTACSSGSGGGDAYPSQVVTMIVNYGAGGGTDLASRALADAASSILGQPVTATNVTGGTGTVGIAELKNSAGDGYTIGVATLAPLAIVPWQMEVPYTPEDFEYICVFGQYGYGLVVNADSPYQTLDDLISAAKASGQMNYGATGYPQPFAMDAINAGAGTNFSFVSYADTTALITDVLGGFIECAVADQASFVSYVSSGQMRLLASATDKRWDAAPDVPTLQEEGYDIALLSYMGLCAPKGVTADQLKTLRDAFQSAHANETFQEILVNSNLVSTYLPGEDYEKLVKEKYEEYKVLFESIG